jgi:predicted site-specific integrase-resolvase
MSNETGYMSLQSVAAELRVAYTGLYKWIRDGLLHQHKQDNRNVYSSEEVEKLKAAFNEEGRNYKNLLANRKKYDL